MNSGGMNRASTGLASSDRASRGALVLLLRVLLFSLLLVCSALVACSLLLSLLATCRLLCATCRVRACCMSLVSCRASLASRASCCVLPTDAQHVSSPLYFSSCLLLCVFDEIVSRFRLFWQRIAVVNDFKEACKAHNKRVSYRLASDLVFYESLLLRKQSVSLTTAILCQKLRKPDMFGMLRRFKCTSQVGATMKATCLEKR